MDEKEKKAETPLTLLLKSPQKSFTSAGQRSSSFNITSTFPGSSTSDTKPTPVIQNVLATVNLGMELDLRKINSSTRNSEYSPARFTGVIMRIREPKTTALIFRTGKMVVTGAKSEAFALLAARKFARIIQKIGFPVKFLDFEVRNVVGTCDLRFPIKLESFHLVHAQYSCYEPELFPAVIYRLVRPRVVLMIYVNGKVVVTGAKNRKEIQDGLDLMTPVLKSFRKQ